MKCPFNYDKELEITNFVNMNNISEEECYAYIDNENEKFCTRLDYYCILFLYHRRNKNFNKCHSLFTKYKFLFKDEFLYNHLYVTVLRNEYTIDSLKKSITISQGLLEYDPRHPGSLVNIAMCNLFLTELEIESSENTFRLTQAYNNISKVIDINPNYAKYYFIKAQVLSKRSEYTEAIKSVKKAIELETSSSKDYALKISEYNILLYNIKMLQNLHIHTLENENKLKDNVDKLKRDSIQVLSFFVAIIAFVMQGANIATKFNVVEASQYILLVFTAIIIAIMGLSTLLSSGNLQKSKYFITFSIVLLLLFLINYIPMILKDNELKKLNISKNTIMMEKK